MQFFQHTSGCQNIVGDLFAGCNERRMDGIGTSADDFFSR
jgi:hypothetical protein